MVIKFKKSSFSITKVIRSDILFIKSNQYIVLQLKETKTKTNHIGVSIIFVAIGIKFSLVVAIVYLYTLNSHSINGSVLCLSSRVFLYSRILSTLKNPIILADPAQANYSGHTFY